tara:strand:- start:689 stop:808 length:120 start_codon:yes stop_codon:yes gene_type:complete
MRQAYPQFAQQGKGGGYAQQDAEEFVTSLFEVSERKTSI